MKLSVRYGILIGLIAAGLFIPFLWSTHLFDWDEINFAECAREMIKTHDYSRIYVDFKPFWEKPPMFFWMQAICMKLFGVNEFAKEGLTRSPMTYTVYAGIFMGLAVLTKGQVALMVFLLVLGVYFIYNHFRLFFKWHNAILFLVVTTLVTLTWYGYETIKNGPWFITEFLKYQYRLFSTHDAGQKGFFGYHYVVILLGCFPASVFAIPSFFKTTSNSRFDKDFKKWMIILFWVVT